MIGRALIGLCAGLSLAACGAPSDRTDETPAKQTPKSVPVIDLPVPELAALLDDGNVRLIDVRTAEEVAEGKIPGAEHIALDSFDPAGLDLSGGREVVLYCRSGRRSGIAGEKLAAHLGKPAKHLAGGILAWRESGRTTIPVK